MRRSDVSVRSLIDIAENKRLRVSMSSTTILTMVDQTDVYQRRSRNNHWSKRLEKSLIDDSLGYIEVKGWNKLSC